MSDPILDFSKFMSASNTPVTPIIKRWEDFESIPSINELIARHAKRGESSGEISDTYHTFNELYHHRAILFATIVNSKEFNNLAWKSRNHEVDGDPMYDGMFIVGIDTPQGQATYHYDIEPYWDMFHCKELENAPKFDGHTPAQAIERIASLWK